MQRCADWGMQCGGCSLRRLHSISGAALMGSTWHLSPGIAGCTPGPGQLSYNMCLLSQGGLREDICVWICTDTLLLTVNLLQRIQIMGRTLVPSSWRASASLTGNACWSWCWTEHRRRFWAITTDCQNLQEMGEASFPKPRLFTLPKITHSCVHSWDTEREESSLAEARGKESFADSWYAGERCLSQQQWCAVLQSLLT